MSPKNESVLWSKLGEEPTNKNIERSCPICERELFPLFRYVQAMKYKNWYMCYSCNYDLFWDPEKHKWYALVPLDKYKIVKKEKEHA
jgi:hypothetical protein